MCPTLVYLHRFGTAEVLRQTLNINFKGWVQSFRKNDGMSSKPEGILGIRRLSFCMTSVSSK